MRQARHASNKDFTARIQKGFEVFDKYYSRTDNSPLYAAALILHPDYRTRYIEANWKPKWVKPALKKVRELWEKYRDESPIRLSPISPIKPVREQKVGDYHQIVRSLKSFSRPSNQDEYKDYCSSEHFTLGEMPVLTWWCQEAQRTRWPRLSAMAIDILSIPAMSAEPERVFSGARRTVSWERAKMSAETLEKVECLKHWKRSGILEPALED